MASGDLKLDPALVLLETCMFHIFSFAGYSGSHSESIESYNVNDNKWTEIDTLIDGGRTKFQACTYYDKNKRCCVLLIGGKSQDRERSKLIYDFDPVKKTIKRLPDLPKGLSGFAAVICHDNLFILGGNDG